MKLRDIIKFYTSEPKQDQFLPIIYRTHGPDGEDILAGFCRWESGQLISEDGDSYSLDDEITDYQIELFHDDEEELMSPYLVVWY